MNAATVGPVYDALLRMIRSMEPEQQQKTLDCLILSLHEDAIQLGFEMMPGLRFKPVVSK